MMAYVRYRGALQQRHKHHVYTARIPAHLSRSIACAAQLLRARFFFARAYLINGYGAPRMAQLKRAIT